MSKIVQAVNAMLTNDELITDVRPSRGEGTSELFFVYKAKYVWSMATGEDGYSLYFYPETAPNSIHQLIVMGTFEWPSAIPLVVYSDAEIGSPEAKESFKALYTLLKERLYGVEEVLDDIISDAFGDFGS